MVGGDDKAKTTTRPTTVKCPTICPNTYAPVCGSDKKTYGNKCQLDSVIGCEKKNIKFSYNGACKDDPPSRNPTPLRTTSSPNEMTTQFTESTRVPTEESETDQQFPDATAAPVKFSMCYSSLCFL